MFLHEPYMNLSCVPWKKYFFLVIFKRFSLFSTMWMHAQACVRWSKYTTLDAHLPLLSFPSCLQGFINSSEQCCIHIFMVNTNLGMRTYLSYLRLICIDSLAWLKSGNHACVSWLVCSKELKTTLTLGSSTYFLVWEQDWFGSIKWKSRM